MRLFARPGRRGVALVPVAILTVLAIARPAPGDTVVGKAGTDTALAATDSRVEVAGRGRFANLRVTVNQTKNLVNQAVSVTWSGGTPTKSGPGRFAGHYLQMMQCWGDDDGTVAANPGPPPEQCVFGAANAVFGGGRLSTLFPSGGFALERIVSRDGWANFDQAGTVDPRTGFLWKPFRAVGGETIATHYNPEFNPAVVGGNYWLNSYFNSITTNEIPGGRTGPDGRGSELVEVTTGVESTGLGCGQAVQPVAGGGHKAPKCWLVIVPRGAARDENAGTPFAETAARAGVFTSPLSEEAWQHRIAIPLDFNAVDTPCDIAAEERAVAGTELVLAAVTSWQPKLCATPGRPPFVYGVISDAAARRQLASGGAGTPGMIAVSRPLGAEAADENNPIVYAPLTASGIVIGFNIERSPRLDAGPEAEALSGVRVARINLTPRLVAKLLSQSYRAQVAIKALPPPDSYTWVGKNPAHLGLDPDFLQFNPEFKMLQPTNAKNLGGLVMSSRNSDVPRQVWEWILADPEAKAWLGGGADAWGMKVNPVYSTNPAVNPAGTAFADPVPDAFPKSDAYCYQGPNVGSDAKVVPPLLCGTDWLPYTQGMRDAARAARLADDGARTNEDQFALSADKVYRPDGPQSLGSRSILALTDSASAAQYGLQTASLSRSGDNTPDRRFVAADASGLLTGLEATAPRTNPAVREPVAEAKIPGAYPLTALTYAAAMPLSLPPASRADYARFLEYAGGEGQIVGNKPGQLPAGYVSLPPAFRQATLAAAKSILALAPPAAAQSVAASAQPSVGGGAVSRSSRSSGASGFSDSSGSTSSGDATPDLLATPGPPLSLDEEVAGAPAEGAEVPVLKTPMVAVAATRFALPGLGALALLSALGALEITKRPRRAVLSSADAARRSVDA